ncbi:MAG TPA: NIPSNAP family protein [Tepidisphaeraceae bacterium]|nr:NIPSNAP family protein [Tepidisphaeraceae bacterium]
MSNRIMLSLVAATVAFVVALAAVKLPAADENASQEPAQQAQSRSSGSAGGRYFEMRTYHAAEGKLEDLHNRFRNHTNRLFKKHGIEMVGYWTVTEAPGAASGSASKDTLVFILAYPSREERDKRWNAFADDPEWKKAKDESEKKGVLVTKVEQVFMNPTDYSPIK